jgi:hypothetical protein
VSQDYATSLLEKLGFPASRYVRGRASIADMFRPGKRCGIYLLHCSNSKERPKEEAEKQAKDAEKATKEAEEVAREAQEEAAKEAKELAEQVQENAKESAKKWHNGW